MLLGGLLGLLLGSFANVLVARIPRGLSIAFPASHCMACGHPIRWYDNIPLISWLLLKGRCRDCAAAIPLRYPLMEAAGALLGALVWSVPESLTAHAGLTLLFVLLLALSVIDWESKLLPDSLSLSALAIGFTLHPLSHFSDILLVVGAGALLRILLSALLKQEAMGEGDLILFAIFAAVVGWKLTLVVIMIGALLAMPVAWRRRLVDPQTPFAPFLNTAFVLVWYFSIDLQNLMEKLYGI